MPAFANAATILAEGFSRFGDLLRPKSYSRKMRLHPEREVKIVTRFQLAPQLAQN